MKKKLIALAALLLAAIFILLPGPSSGVCLRFQLHIPKDDTAEYDDFKIYYTSHKIPAFCEEQTIVGELTEATGVITFNLTPAIVDDIGCIRFDFPQLEQEVAFKAISVSSAGVIKKNFNPCTFLAEENMDEEHDLKSVSISPAMGRVTYETYSDDPYLVFSNDLLYQIIKHNSHYRLTRFVICLLIGLGYFLWKRNLFHTEV